MLQLLLAESSIHLLLVRGRWIGNLLKGKRRAAATRRISDSQ